jgi:thioredoxin 1
MGIKHTSDASLGQDVLESDAPVLVDYWAEWCGPCKMIAPILDEVARDYDGRLQVVKVNVDENSATAGKYGIRGIPTLMLFRNGQKVDQKVGALSKSQLTLFLDQHLDILRLRKSGRPTARQGGLPSSGLWVLRPARPRHGIRPRSRPRPPGISPTSAHSPALSAHLTRLAELTSPCTSRRTQSPARLRN